MHVRTPAHHPDRPGHEPPKPQRHFRKTRQPAAQAQATEVDVAIRDLKGHPGFAAYMILNNDGTSSPPNGV